MLTEILKKFEEEEEKGKRVDPPVMVKYLRSVFSYASSYFVSEAVNAGRFNAVKFIDGIEIASAQWSAILDERTCMYCQELDEKIIGVDNPLYAVQQPPAHGHCRCVFIYTTTEEEGGIVEDWPEPSLEEIASYSLYDIKTDQGKQLLSNYFGERAVRNAIEFASSLDYDEDRIKDIWNVEESPF